MSEKLQTSSARLRSFLSFFVLSQPLGACAVFGGRPTGERLKRVQASPHFQVAQGKFINQNPKFTMGGSGFKIFKDMLFGKEQRVPSQPLPEVKPDLKGLIHASESLKFIWLGHSSFLLRIGQKTVLVDPVLGPYASPVPIFGKRFQQPVLTAADLPPIDLVLISHDHYDHLEMETMRHFIGTPTQFIVPLGVGAHLESWGIEATRIRELDWWESTEWEDLELVCTPAQHFSGRGARNQNETLWASWVVKTKGEEKQKRVYFSGDSGYAAHYREIGDRHGPFDLTFIENGQYNVNWPSVHQLPEEALQAHLDLRGQALVPVHWGAYQLSFHDWFEPAERLYAAAALRGVQLLTPRLGQLHDLARLPAMEPWWRVLSNKAR